MVYPKIHILNQHDSEVHNAFALTTCLEVILSRKFWIDNQKLLYFNHGIKADKSRNLNWK